MKRTTKEDETMTPDELKTIINGLTKRAELRDVDLSWADLSGANLHRASFRGADLSDADFSGADLSGATIDGTVLMRHKMTNHPGVYYDPDDKDNGPFALRVGGTADYVSRIDPGDRRCYPPGSVDTVRGRTGSLAFDTLEEALVAADEVFRIECHVSIEPTHYGGDR